MSIKQELMARLSQLAADGPEKTPGIIINQKQLERYTIVIPAEKNRPTVSLTLADYDRYSVTFCNLSIKHNTPAPVHPAAVTEYLQEKADLIIQQINYLVEPLTLIELDPTEGVAQLRSVPHDPNAPERTYWEAILQVGEHPKITMARYHWHVNAADRELIAYPSIFDNLARLAEDLALVLVGPDKG